MNAKNIFYPMMTAVSLQLLLMAAAAQGLYLVWLPDTPATPPLGYKIDPEDHFGGPAAIQMALNACPTVSERHLNKQGEVYKKVLLHNDEGKSLGWFSDPRGIKGALEDPAFNPCGNWVDISNTDKMKVLRNMLYYMDQYRYLSPVSIGTGEYWVAVNGFLTTSKPPSSGTVKLIWISYYDPLATTEPVYPVLVNPTVWLHDSRYWGKPHDRPGSAWHNHYLAVIDPPDTELVVQVPEWRRDGEIREPDWILESLNRWLQETRETVRQSAGELREYRPHEDTFTAVVGEPRVGLLEALLASDEIEDNPIRVDAGEYVYYLAPLGDSRLIAVVNAYDGSFEELRFAAETRRRVLDPDRAIEVLAEVLERSGIHLQELLSDPVLVYREDLSPAGRTAPAWEIRAVVLEREREEREILLHLSVSGELVSVPSPEAAEIR